MQTWLARIFPALGLLLLALSTTAAVQPEEQPDPTSLNLILRQVGHDYLRTLGDSTSRIPAVVRDGENYRLPLSADIDYGLITTLTRIEMHERGIDGGYELSLTDCTTGEIFLGGNWPSPYAADPENGEIACQSREQEGSCSDVNLRLLPLASAGNPRPWLLAGGGLFLLLGLVIRFRPTAVAPEEAVAENEAAQPAGVALGPTAVFHPEAPELIIAGQAVALTFREAKLLRYLVDNGNTVLDRQAIHDAVWGDEGVIVGRSLDVFISRLRKKLADAEGVEIQTVHGVGYRLRTSPAATHA